MYRPSFPLVAVSQVDVQMTSKGASPGHTSPVTLGPALCEDGRPYITDPVTGRKICACNLGPETPFDPRSLLPDARKKGMSLPEAVGGTSIGIDASAFYSPLIRGMPAVRHEQLPPPYLTSAIAGQPVPFDPALAAHPYGLLYAGLDVNGGPIRKAATRETTGPLKIWLSEHKKNPYPTKAEKIMLAIITRMTLTQVSTWFANARRRLKKENKLYSADRENAADDDDDDEDFNENPKEGNSSQSAGTEKQLVTDSDTEDINVDLSDFSDAEDPASCQPDLRNLGQGREKAVDPDPSDYRHGNDVCRSKGTRLNEQHHASPLLVKSSTESSRAGVSPSSTDRPKIWSVSDIINGPSVSDDGPRRTMGASVTSVQANPSLTKQVLSLSSISSLQQAPSGISLAMTSHTISSPLISLSSPSSSSSLSPTSFRPVHSLMGVPPLFLHRPEFSGCMRGYGLPTVANGLPHVRGSLTSGGARSAMEDTSQKTQSRKTTTQPNSGTENPDRYLFDGSLKQQQNEHTTTNGRPRLDPENDKTLTLPHRSADSSSYSSSSIVTSASSKSERSHPSCTESHKVPKFKPKAELPPS